MRKVKKSAAKVGRRNAKVKRASKAGKGARKSVARSAAPIASFTVKPLDPLRKCGPATSVELLFRVDERTGDQRTTPHLVFFDRHGWYCEHGRTCPAVLPARKYKGQRARNA